MKENHFNLNSIGDIGQKSIPELGFFIKDIKTFILNLTDSIKEIEIIRDLGFGLGAEAARILKESPKWIPGQLNGKPTRMIYSLPITINSNI